MIHLLAETTQLSPRVDSRDIRMKSASDMIKLYLMNKKDLDRYIKVVWIFGGNFSIYMHCWRAEKYI